MRAALAMVLLSGCASYGAMTSARPVPAGASQVTTALELDGAGVIEDDARIPSPTFAVGVRRGLGHDVDVGGTLSILPFADALTTLGLEAQARWRVLGDDDSRVELAIAPSTGWRETSSSGARWDAANAVLATVVGVNVGRHQLYLAPRAGWQRWWSAGAMPVDVPFAGAAIGVVWKVGRRWAVVPEASALQTPTTVDQSDGMALVNLGIGLVFDAD